MPPDRSDFPQRVPTNTNAVYALCWKGHVVYVGQSKQIHARLSRHRHNYTRWIQGKPRKIYELDAPIIQFDDIWVRYCSEGELDNLEFAMVQKYRPECNIKLMKADPVEVEIRAGRTRIDLEKLGLNKWTTELKRSSRNFARRI